MARRIELDGRQRIGAMSTASGTRTFAASDPATGEALEPRFHEATAKEVGQAVDLAAQAFDAYRRTSPERIAAFLEAIAEGILELGDQLLERAAAETGLPQARLSAERTRTASQARLFAALAREGSWIDARIDRAQPARQPSPRPDIRRMLIPIGPVAVFGASNFPLAISVAGTDTVSALTAGSPVVAKAHPAHPGTCELLAGAILGAAARTGLPDGVFSLVQGAGHDVGLALAKHPRTRAVAFTGSLQGGRGLFAAAAARPDPIPVYAEMGSVNPVFLLPGALEERGERIAEGFVGSLTLGVGQFCTNPGMVVGPSGAALERFVAAAGQRVSACPPGTMLHAGIRAAYEAGVERTARSSGVRVAARSAAGPDPKKTQAACVLFATDAAALLADPDLAQENFGPSSIVVRCASGEEMERVAESLDGHLTATIHGTPEDLARHRRLVEVLERKAGRLIFNGFPTGVEVCHAMHHGGPYPATTHSGFTSIGTAAVYRFVRPVCYQDFPQDALPEALRDGNPRKIWRLVEGQLTRD
ncbi:MAG: aldehyde dehydrogenase (NADP(+)) [Planctomycetes bacterium]|nr:aldehyde dehydrogenase (NADP(+)) [Planctomycetota bacterium]